MNDSTDLDSACINTIRTLSMDARAGGQLRAPRHADGAWRRWPTACGSSSCASTRRTRSGPTATASSSRYGHASMLLYSLLHLTGVKAVSKDYETLGEPSVPLDAIKQLPPARQPMPRPSGVPLDQRRRDHHRPARQGRGHQRRHGHRRPLAGRSLQPARLRGPVRLQRLRHVRRRLHDGGHLRRGRLARRPPASSPTCAGSTTTTTSPSKATPPWPSATTWPRASSATAGTSSASATPTTWRCWRRPSAPSRPRTTGRR